MPKIMNTDKTNKLPFELYAQKHFDNVSNIMSKTSNNYFKMGKFIKITVSQQTHSALLHKMHKTFEKTFIYILLI